MTITLIPEVEGAVCEAARRQGTTPDQVANETLKSLLPLAPQEPVPSEDERAKSKQEALARIQSGYYARRLSSSEDFEARKKDEIALQERRAQVRAARGSLAHLGPSRLMQDKAEERAREERRWKAKPEDSD